MINSNYRALIIVSVKIYLWCVSHQHLIGFHVVYNVHYVQVTGTKFALILQVVDLLKQLFHVVNCVT